MSYVANYESLNRPYICKVLTASSGEEFHVSLNFSNDSEREEMSAELIYEHLENCVKYMADKAHELVLIKAGESIGSEPNPVKGWAELEWTNNEINLWFMYVYYKAEGSLPESEPLELNLTVDTEEAEEAEEAEETPDA